MSGAGGTPVAGGGEGQQVAGRSRYRWYVLALLTAAQVCSYMDRTIIGIVIEPVRAEFGLSDGQMGFLSGLAFGLAFAVAAIPMGWLVDRCNRRKLLALIVALWSGLTMFCGLAQSYLMLLLSRMSVGAAEAGGSPTGVSILSDYFGPRERASAVAIWYSSSTLAVILTFLFGGFVAQQFGWRATFLFAGAPGLVVALLIFLTLREPVRGVLDHSGGKAQRQPLGLRQGAAYVLRRRGLMHCMAGIILSAATVSAMSIWMVTFLTRFHGLDLARAGMVAGIGLGIFGSLGGIACGFIADRLNKGSAALAPGRSALLCATTALLAIVFGMVAVLAQSTLVAVGFMFVYALFKTAHNGPANALMLGLVGSHVRGFSVSTLQIGTNLVSWGMGPLVVGLLSDYIGGPQSLRWALAITLLINAWAVAHYLLAARHVAADMERTHED